MNDRFRSAREDDLDAILPMMRDYYAEDDYPFDVDASRQAALELIRREELGRLWVAVNGEAVVGYLAVTLGFSLEYRGRDAFIDELFIAKGSRGKGFGREAMATAETFCRENGVQALHLEVERHREAALELYGRAGFKDHDRHPMTKRL